MEKVDIYNNKRERTKYKIVNMNNNILKEIVTWKYDGEYSEYNIDSYQELKKRGASILNPSNVKNYLCYINEKNELVGYTNMCKKSNGEVFLGIGLAPKYCGMGLGSEILKKSVKVLMENHPNSIIKLQVRSWNERAIKCYEKSGFKYIKKEKMKDHNGIETEFVFMELEIKNGA